MQQTNEVAQVAQALPSLMDTGLREGYRIVWGIVVRLVSQYWVYILVFTLLLYTVAFFEARVGRWGMLGRLLYHTLYFGCLALLALLAGPELFANEYVNIAIVVLLYPLCFKVSGLILNKLGISTKRFPQQFNPRYHGHLRNQK